MIRFGIVGTNWITDRFLKGALKVEGFSLNAVYSRSEEKADNFRYAQAKSKLNRDNF
ncbi:putative dehydrogenase [Paenibacillus sp. V4I3]|nr:putative dehydrogenase [Paenibacillus sp. V4I3]MDQ0886460.1 putative dehydrogenase [Paenibacillus sp. V4I9]